MSDRKQTRRSISISGPTYSRLKAHCEEKGCSMSSVVEQLLKDTLPAQRKDTPPLQKADRVDKIREIVQRKAETPDQGGGIFTF